MEFEAWLKRNDRNGQQSIADLCSGNRLTLTFMVFSARGTGLKGCGTQREGSRRARSQVGFQEVKFHANFNGNPYSITKSFCPPSIVFASFCFRCCVRAPSGVCFEACCAGASGFQDLARAARTI